MSFSQAVNSFERTSTYSQSQFDEESDGNEEQIDINDSTTKKPERRESSANDWKWNRKHRSTRNQQPTNKSEWLNGQYVDMRDSKLFQHQNQKPVNQRKPQNRNQQGGGCSTM